MELKRESYFWRRECNYLIILLLYPTSCKGLINRQSHSCIGVGKLHCVHLHLTHEYENVNTYVNRYEEARIAVLLFFLDIPVDRSSSYIDVSDLTTVLV